MKKAQSPTIELAASLQRFYDYFNKELIQKQLGNPLPQVLITTGKGGRSSGHFITGKWKVASGSSEALPEINLASEWLVTDAVNSSLETVMQTLVHEMVHFYDHQWGRPGKHGYHSDSWFRFMKQVGLQPVHKPGNRFKVGDKVIPDGAFEVAYKALPKDMVIPFENNYAVQPAVSGVGVKVTLQGKKFKYTCPMCGSNCQAANGRKFICGECQEPMHQEEK
jgi:predicted SprT family Zn-dependent metalloprotease